MAKDLGLPQKLDDLYEHLFKSKREKSHNALDDANDLAHVYRRMREIKFSREISRIKMG